MKTVFVIEKANRIDPKTLKAPLSSIGKKDRVTPGRSYHSVLGPDHRGKEVLWIDFHFRLVCRDEGKHHEIGKTTNDEAVDIIWSMKHIVP